jgi:hypothetical protein
MFVAMLAAGGLGLAAAGWLTVPIGAWHGLRGR